MSRSDRWPERCTLIGCSYPDFPGHHHHYLKGHLRTGACMCPEMGEPGTRSRPV